MAVDELKSRCLDQLEVMSKKRLLKIMEGREMSCSTSESEHGEISQSDVKDTNNPTTVEQHNPPTLVETQVQAKTSILDFFFKLMYRSSAVLYRKNVF